MTLDARAQLYAGCLAVAKAVMVSLGYSQENVRSTYPNDSLLKGISTDGPNPLVVVSLGKSGLSKAPSGASVSTPLGALTDPTQTTGVLLTATQALTTPVTFAVIAGGAGGKTLRGATSDALASYLGSASTISLPDDQESTTGFSVTTPTAFRLSAQLAYISEMEDNSLAEHRLYRADLLYSATHWRYSSQTVSLIRNVNISVVIPTFR